MRRIIAGLLVLLFLTPAVARAQESAFREDCSLYIERELWQVPLDNAAKYATLFVVASTIWETAPAMLALAREEGANDVRAAMLRGAAKCLKDPEHRALANKAIAIRKATNDWSGFGGDLAKIANMRPNEMYKKVVLSQGLFDDLEQGGEGLSEIARVRRQIMTGRKPSFQADLKAKQKLAEIFGDSCLPESFETVIDDMQASMEAREDSAAREMAMAARALTGVSMSLNDILAFNAGPYVGSNASQASRFIGSRGDYRLIQELRQWTRAYGEKVNSEVPKQQAIVKRLTLHLRDAHLALQQCNQPRMMSALQLVSREPGILAATPINRLISLLSGETGLYKDAELRMQVATKDACYGGVVAQYNDLVEDYQRLKDVNLPGRDAERFMSLLEDADALALACKAEPAEKLLDQAFKLVPASLDPGNLCINAEQAERSYERRQGVVRGRQQNCQTEEESLPNLTYTCEQHRGAIQYYMMKGQKEVCDELRAQHGKTGRTRCKCCYTPDNVMKGCFLSEGTVWAEMPDGGKRQVLVPLTPVPE